MPQGCDPSQEAQGRAGCGGFQPPPHAPPSVPQEPGTAVLALSTAPRLAPVQSWGEQIRRGCSKMHSQAVGPRDSAEPLQPLLPHLENGASYASVACLTGQTCRQRSLSAHVSRAVPGAKDAASS